MTTSKDFTPDILIYNNKVIRTTLINGIIFLVGGDCCKSLNLSTKWGTPRYRHLLEADERMLLFKEELPTVLKWKDYESALTVITLSGFDKLKLASKGTVTVNHIENMNTTADLSMSIAELIAKYTPNKLQIPIGI